MPTERTIEVAAILKDARHKLGLTQKEVAERAGITPNTYARIERAVSEPDTPSLRGIIEALKLDPAKVIQQSPKKADIPEKQDMRLIDTATMQLLQKEIPEAVQAVEVAHKEGTDSVTFMLDAFASEPELLYNVVWLAYSKGITVTITSEENIGQTED